MDVLFLPYLILSMLPGTMLFPGAIFILLYIKKRRSMSKGNRIRRSFGSQDWKDKRQVAVWLG